MGDRLKGTVAIVTGGASGMGRATVARFVAEGACVVIADLQRDKGEQLARDMGDCTRFVATDVCDEREIQALVETTVQTFGPVTCMFNNAGFGGVTGEVDAIDMGEPYERTVGAMLTGVIAGIKHVTPVMKAHGGGSIISTASVAGLMGGYGPHVYSAVKSAVVNLTRSVALELGPHNIRVNAICPGGIATPIFAGQLAVGGNQDYAAAVRPGLSLMQPIPRAGEPEDIANAACFLASDESSFITGHALVVDGGLTAGAWSHPSLGAGGLNALAPLMGLESLDQVDMVYHAPD